MGHTSESNYDNYLGSIQLFSRTLLLVPHDFTRRIEHRSEKFTTFVIL